MKTSKNQQRTTEDKTPVKKQDEIKPKQTGVKRNG